MNLGFHYTLTVSLADGVGSKAGCFDLLGTFRLRSEVDVVDMTDGLLVNISSAGGFPLKDFVGKLVHVCSDLAFRLYRQSYIPFGLESSMTWAASVGGGAVSMESVDVMGVGTREGCGVESRLSSWSSMASSSVSVKSKG
ncbi:hypothetical protein M569_17728 [Genlisea aurea]|uniref:Uncharacterized protein n=1 Tax=Genlisea aurea TaxID=192259 RepID=S8DCL2_9LAMI|nr:hypothetical protein M569_17728 [Genlisea aurea]